MSMKTHGDLSGFFRNVGDATRNAVVAARWGEFSAAGWQLGFASCSAMDSLPYGSPERKAADAWVDGCLRALYAIEARARKGR